MKNVLVLNSGGFDSVVLLHYLKDEYRKCNFKSVFFNWGQPNMNQEWNCAYNVSSKLGTSFDCIDIDNESIWNVQEGYIPMRNFVFIANAVAYALTNGYDTIVMAIINNGGDESETYPDCTQDFVDRVNNLINPLGLELYTPFIDLDKIEVSLIAKKYVINKSDFFSCNTPKYNKLGELIPCGECMDCKQIEYIYTSIQPNEPYSD